ncbi:zf-HC2 domain-containing protein [Thiohalophilus sp.]|uniref:zf-HC2 domain-containing protein n=1 Tax=Thiohalophilus sp. TaxID=3028392 RepID=UPI002ACE084B|nr:zf-HC2 domain-containing protein [Thiohalophilus sp.]MDZ7661568.1 zf-HC2 domain-containing protein [Thiohalophilus sp.]MDZ7803539.1 zf-HC2 domain-containing protein [Thiohalophilus sp.]
MLNCKDTTKLLSQQQDESLSFRKRVALRFHLMMCSGCRNYNKQIDFIHKACQRFSGKN